MARPAMFDNVPLKEPEHKQRAAKPFEQRVKRGLESLGGWTARFVDAVGVDEHGRRKNMAGAVTPPDFIHVNDGFNLLVEAKTFKLEPGEALPQRVDFNRLAPHQFEDLLAFDGVSDLHFGFIAMLFYNDLTGKQRVYRGWLLPIIEWVRLQAALDRASIPRSEFEGDLAGYEMRWVPGTKSYFDPRPALIYEGSIQT